jgi:hypothetical protein
VDPDWGGGAHADLYRDSELVLCKKKTWLKDRFFFQAISFGRRESRNT